MIIIEKSRSILVKRAKSLLTKEQTKLTFSSRLITIFMHHDRCSSSDKQAFYLMVVLAKGH
jgi:hypothetical protein